MYLPWLYWTWSIINLRRSSTNAFGAKFFPLYASFVLSLGFEIFLGLDSFQRYVSNEPLIRHTSPKWFIASLIALGILGSIAFGICLVLWNRKILSGKTNFLVSFFVFLGLVAPVIWYLIAGPIFDLDYYALCLGWFLSQCAGYCLVFYSLHAMKVEIENYSK